LRFEAVNITKAPTAGAGTENNIASIGNDQSILQSLGIIPLKAFTGGVQIPARQSQVQGDTDSGPDVKYQFWVAFDTTASSIAFDLITIVYPNTGSTTGTVVPVTTGIVPPLTTGFVVPVTTGIAAPLTTGSVPSLTTSPITSGAIPASTTGSETCSFDCHSGTVEDRLACLEAALCQLQALLP